MYPKDQHTRIMSDPAQAASASAAAAAPLTPHVIQVLVKETMMVQQTQLLTLAETDALKMLCEENKRNQPSWWETINADVGAIKEYDNHEWQNPTNKLTFDAMHQIDWGKRVTSSCGRKRKG